MKKRDREGNEEDKDEDSKVEMKENESLLFWALQITWKSFYLLAWLAAAVYSLYNIYLFVNKYFGRPTQTVITSMKLEHEMPTISICNMNRIEKSFLDANPVLQEVWETLESPEFVDWENETLAKVGRLTYIDVYEHSFGWQQVLDQCKYGGWRDCEDKNLYNLTELFADVVGGSGKCYSFNPRGEVLSNGVGDEGSFRFLMDVHRDEYLADIPEVGFVVDIHHHTNYQGSTKIEMSPGYKYKVGIKPKIRKELPIKLGGKCDPELTKNSYLAYDVDSCEYECRDKYINDTCGCIISAPPNNTFNYLTCSIRQMEDCAWWAYYEFLTRKENMPPEKATEQREVVEEGSLGDHGPNKGEMYVFNKPQLRTTGPNAVTTAWTGTWATGTVTPTTSTTGIVGNGTSLNCSKSCPPPCSKNYYEIVVSSSEISSRHAQALAEELPVTAEYLLQNHILMEFYLTDSFAEVISSVSAYDLWDLLSDIGGVMGLFLGASIFSFFAFFKATVLRIYNNQGRPFYDFLKDVLVST